MDKDLSKVKRDLRKLLRSQLLAVLSTQNQGQPYASLVAFASSDDLKSLYFATTRSTRKYANLSPSCAFCKIRVQTIFVVTRFQSVVEIRVRP